VVGVIGVEPREGYELRLTFSDGSVGDIDLTEQLWGDVFEPLRDPAVFRRVEVDPELGTVVWSNGADLDPEGLREAVRPVQPAA
jgi:hypothetical protein